MHIDRFMPLLHGTCDMFARLYSLSIVKVRYRKNQPNDDFVLGKMFLVMIG